MGWWQLIFPRRGRLRFNTKTGIPPSNIGTFDVLKQSFFIVLILWQAITLLAAQTEWEVKVPEGGDNPYEGLISLVAAIYVVGETIDEAADAALVHALQPKNKASKVMLYSEVIV